MEINCKIDWLQRSIFGPVNVNPNIMYSARLLPQPPLRVVVGEQKLILVSTGHLLVLTVRNYRDGGEEVSKHYDQENYDQEVLCADGTAENITDWNKRKMQTRKRSTTKGKYARYIPLLSSLISRTFQQWTSPSISSLPLFQTWRKSGNGQEATGCLEKKSKKKKLTSSIHTRKAHHSLPIKTERSTTTSNEGGWWRSLQEVHRFNTRFSSHAYMDYLFIRHCLCMNMCCCYVHAYLYVHHTSTRIFS